MSDAEFDPTYDPTNGKLPPTEFPHEDVPDPEQTAEDLGTADDEALPSEPVTLEAGEPENSEPIELVAEEPKPEGTTADDRDDQ